MNEEVGSVTTAIVEKIDQMVESGNLSTREGQSLLISVFREGMITMGGISKRLPELEAAYVRFTNTMDSVHAIETANQKKLDEILPVFNAVKWVGTTLAGLILILIWSLVTGKAAILWR